MLPSVLPTTLPRSPTARHFSRADIRSLRPRTAPLDRASVLSTKVLATLSQEALTPLSTIQVCLESLSYSEREADLKTGLRISPTLRKVFLEMALLDLNRLREMVQCLLESISSTQTDHGDRDLLAIVGHELRTPLTTLYICLESLASEPEMAEVQQQVLLKVALRDVERLRRLIQNFFTLFRLESTQINNCTERLCLTEVITVVLTGFQQRYQLFPLPKIHLNLPIGLPLVQADGDRLAEVLRQMLDNACKFTAPTGQIWIRIQWQGDHPFLRVCVTDTGRGIDPRNLTVIFQPFYQEEGPLRRTVGGTGIGLAICKQIIESLDGQIGAESGGRGRGSCFWFTVPIAMPA